MQLIVLLDTNVVLDYLLDRDGSEYTYELFKMARENKSLECVTSSIITDIHYITKVHSEYTSFDIQDIIETMITFLEVLDVTKEDIEYALSLRWDDFEDAVQYSVAYANGIDCIITNNKKDFIKSDIEVLTPAEFLSKYAGRRHS